MKRNPPLPSNVTWDRAGPSGVCAPNSAVNSTQSTNVGGRLSFTPAETIVPAFASTHAAPSTEYLPGCRGTNAIFTREASVGSTATWSKTYLGCSLARNGVCHLASSRSPSFFFRAASASCFRTFSCSSAVVSLPSSVHCTTTWCALFPSDSMRARFFFVSSTLPSPSSFCTTTSNVKLARLAMSSNTCAWCETRSSTAGSGGCALPVRPYAATVSRAPAATDRRAMRSSNTGPLPGPGQAHRSS